MANEFDIGTVLLVEDSDDDVVITQRKLFKSSLKIDTFLVAKNFNEGVKLVQEHPVDIVLLDLNLPESKELETLDNFKKVYQGIIVVVTSLDNEKMGIEAIRKGADDYIIKGYMTESVLAQRILYAKERRKMRDHVHSLKSSLLKLDQLAGG